MCIVTGEGYVGDKIQELSDLRECGIQRVTDIGTEQKPLIEVDG